jgi:hypothetical protein
MLQTNDSYGRKWKHGNASDFVKLSFLSVYSCDVSPLVKIIPLEKKILVLSSR